MAKDRLHYGRLVEDALRTVVRDVLKRTAKEGLLGQHHFYITFRTGDPGVEIADYLRERYPTEMTIVIQHQYWDLQVDDEKLAVSLSFNNMPERLVIPFRAIKVFADPGVEFGLQFTLESEPAPAEVAPLALPPAPPATVTPIERPAAESGAEVVSLDRFRRR